MSEKATESEFTIRRALIRYHEPKAGTAINVPIDPPDATGILNLVGWPEGSARIEGCHLMRDESLPRGTLVVEPLVSVLVVED